MTIELQTDYLIVGSGAVGMAFADTLVDETDADVVIVDRFAKPGGHWNSAYPFVTLHQPSQFYGVASRELSQGVRDQVGLNTGLNDLASGQEVLAYFDHVMRHTLLPSGRVRYFPMCDYAGGGNFRHKLTGEDFHVEAQTLVDCTHLNTSVPSTHTPSFEIEDGVRFMALNELPKLTEPPAQFVVVGGGKTGIDAILWLLEMRVDPDRITWVVSRDGWMLNRKNTQPGLDFFEHTIGAQAAQFESIAEADSIEDMFDRLEASGYFVRLDPDVRPTMFHGATISELELEALRAVKDVVRMGRVERLTADEVVFVGGATVPSSPDHLFIDCSASAIMEENIKPVFEPGVITPQTVRSYQPVFSASFIAHVEATRETLDEKNGLCPVVPLPNADVDYLRLTLASMVNQFTWSQDGELRRWLRGNRLDGFSEAVSQVGKDDEEKIAILNRIGESSFPAAAKLQEFIDQATADGRL